jgi:phage FluMu gp28-like protein
MSKAPTVLLKYQQEWLADKSPVRLAEKSRRIGLSWAQASESALEAAAENGMDSWYIGYNKEMAQEFIRDVGFWAKHYNLTAGEMEEVVLADEDKDILAFRVVFASGYRVTALSSRPANLRGKQGLVIIDEAAFHDQLDELIKAAMALLIWGGRVCIISTHDGEDNPFNELIKAINEGKFKYSLHTISFDDALSQGLYKRICLKMGRKWTQEGENAWRQEIIDFYGEAAEEELFCIPKKGTGLYFSNVLLDSVSQPGIPIFRLAFKDEFTTRSEAERTLICRNWWEENIKPVLGLLNAWKGDLIKSYYGFDFARTGDLSCFWPLLVENRLRKTPFVIELKNTPFKQQEQILFWTVDNLPRFMHGSHDARGNGSYIAEVALQRYGTGRITQVMPSQQWYGENFPKYKSGMEDGLLVMPQDPDIKGDHRMVKTQKGVPKVPETAHRKGVNGEKRHGDSAIAGCLAWHATEQASVNIEFESTGPRDCSAGNLSDYYGG